MANYTQNYQLHQWVPEDNFLRTDFNEDFQKIDTAIKSTETGLQANLNGQVSRLDGAIATAQQTVQNNLNTQVARLDGAIATAQQTARNELNSSISTVNASIQSVQALANSKCTFACGKYTGDGAASRFISLGFTPTLVMVTNQKDEIYEGGSYYYGGIAIAGMPAESVEITTNGFYVKNDSGNIRCNYKSASGTARLYLYLAFQ